MSMGTENAIKNQHKLNNTISKNAQNSPQNKYKVISAAKSLISSIIEVFFIHKQLLTLIKSAVRVSCTMSILLILLSLNVASGT